MTNVGGYMGKILRLNLTDKSSSTLDVGDEMRRKYFGGFALSMRLMHEMVPPQTCELGPENKVFMMISPVTGTGAPGTSLVNVLTKSPLYNGIASTQMNGFLGRRIKTAGYDGIILEGQSDEWVYAAVINDNVEFGDASFLLGKDTFETEKLLKEKYDLPKASVVCIGPSGENLVKFAAVEADEGHFASTGGAGAVIGSKKLKAVLVYGDKKPVIADPEGFKKAVRPWVDAVMVDPAFEGMKLAGTLSTIETLYSTRMVPVKNLQESDFSAIEDFSVQIHRKDIGVKFTEDGCYGCPIVHCKKFEITKGPHKGATGDEAEYEGYANFGPNLLITDPLDALFLSSLNDRMGMDLKECGFSISWAMECYEKGYLTKEDTDGLDLTWGNVKATEELIKRIAHREGKFADMLADGLWRASTKVGGEAEKFAVLCKRHAPHAHDPRIGFSITLSQCVTDVGSWQGGNYMQAEPASGLLEAPDLMDPLACAYASGVCSKRAQWRDSMLICMFTESMVPFEHFVNVANAVTGWDITPEEAMIIGDRATHLARTFNLRAGLTPQDDTGSYRAIYDAPVGGPTAGIPVAALFSLLKMNFYAGIGWDVETSKPLPETLKRDGLSDLIPLLW